MSERVECLQGAAPHPCVSKAVMPAFQIYDLNFDLMVTLVTYEQFN